MTASDGQNESRSEGATTSEGDAPRASGIEGDPPAQQAVSEAKPAADDALAAAKAAHDKVKDQLLRTAADFDNYRKRARKDVEEAARRGKEDVVREVLPVADNLERAIQAAEKASEIGAVVDGVKMVSKLLEDALDRVGVTRVKAVGERFDPSLHDAIQQVETDEVAPGTIVAELAAGYRIGDKLVRAAMVAVAKAKPQSASGSGGEDVISPEDSGATDG